MANLASALKQEIARIARREIRAQTETTKKASTQHRRHIAMLRRRIAALEQSMARLSIRLVRESAAPAQEPAPDNQIRFVAKGVRSLRERLGLSAERFGRLIGVSAQSIYNWERQVTTPRGEQLKLLAAVRGIGKREAAARLQELESKPGG